MPHDVLKQAEFRDIQVGPNRVADIPTSLYLWYKQVGQVFVCFEYQQVCLLRADTRCKRLHLLVVAAAQLD